MILLDHKAKPSGLSCIGNPSCSPRHRGTAVFLLQCCKWICMKALKMPMVWNNRQTHTNTHRDLSGVVYCLQRSFPEGDGGFETTLCLYFSLSCLAQTLMCSYYGCCFSEHLLCHRCSPRLISKPLIIPPKQRERQGGCMLR